MLKLAELGITTDVPYRLLLLLAQYLFFSAFRLCRDCISVYHQHYWTCVFSSGQISELERDKNFLEEIRREEQERQRLEEERRERKAEFKQRAALFNHA